MQRFPAGGLADLLAAAEAVGDAERVCVGGAHSRQQHAFGTAHRYLVLVRVETERSGHATAAGIKNLVIETEVPRHLPVSIRLQDRFVVAVRMDDRRPLELRQGKRGVALQELAEQEHLDERRLACSSPAKRSLNSSRNTERFR